MASEDTPQKNWSFFRAGGVVQVEMKSAEDLKRLDQLDPKHWMALAMPVQGVHLDPRTLSILDSDHDGQVRPPELIDAVQWVSQRVRDFSLVMQNHSSAQRPGDLASPDDSLSLELISAPELVQCAQRIIADISVGGKEPQNPPPIHSQTSHPSISLGMVDQALQLFKESPLNGDGVITPDASHQEDIKKAIQWVIDTQGHETDRSGKPGMTREKVESFFTALESRRTWLLEGAHLLKPEALQTDKVDAGTLDTVENWYQLDKIFHSVCQPINDFFDLCQLSRLNEKIATQWQEPPMETRALRPILETTPIAPLRIDGELSLEGPLNPLWTKPLRALVMMSHKMGIWTGSAKTLNSDQWEELKAYLEKITHWIAQKPQSSIEPIPNGDVLYLLEKNIKTTLLNLIETDLQKAHDYEAHADLQKLLLLKRDLLKITQNFVNFSDFYRHRNGIFQAGTLYIDGRSTQLCLEQINPARHATLDPQSGAFVVYCECTRAQNPPKSIIAIITDGEGSQMSVGRAGIFVDKQGHDWSALITKVIANPVSYREAFWSPYRRIVRWVEEQISKKMAAADVTTPTELAKVSEKLPAPTDAPKDGKPASGPAGPKIDVGTVAALGVALGSIGTFVGVVTTKFFGLGVLMPFGIIGVILMISGPSVVLAWFKLKNRNLAPILDANGWAINTRAIINVPFASSLTSLRQVPLSLGSVMPDPYAEKSRPWKLYWGLGILGFIALLWLGGHLDRYLPKKVRFNEITQSAKATVP